MVACFTIISIPALIPFLRLLFGLESTDQTAPTGPLTTDNALDYMKYQLVIWMDLYGRETVVAWMCVFLVSVFFFKNLFRYLSLVVLAPVRNGIVRDVRQALYRKILDLPVGFFSEEKKGNLISRFSADATEMEWSILNVLESIFRSPFIILGSILYMLYVSPQLTVYVVLMAVVIAFLIGTVSRTLKKNSSAAQGQLGETLSIVEESISGQKVIKAFHAESYLFGKFQHSNNTFKRMLDRILWKRDAASPMSEFFGIVALALLLWLGSREVFNSGVDPAFFLTFLFAFFNVIDPAKQLSNAVFNIKKGIAAYDRIEEILQIDTKHQQTGTLYPAQPFEKEIHFKDVSFVYPASDRTVINNLNLTIKKGEKIAVVGPSGAGKSTLLDLLPRFYDVNSGSILIDNKDIRDLDMGYLRGLFGIVTQDPILFNDTIYNNIVFGQKNISSAQVEEAARMAYAHDFIMDAEQGYQTIIGDRGVKLSGGQKQRITIARAILKNPPVFLLDEATSSLDTASERIVQAAIDKAMENRTAIIIAHRLSTIQHADRILVMHQGNIVEQGTHQELMQSNTEYSKLVQLQHF
jgi:ABC-type multidrug transport system fused ATPase/permease subunit